MTARPGLGLGVRARARLGAITLVARLNLVWERFWPRLIPLLAIVAAFVAVALLDLLPQLPFWLHLFVLVGFGAGAAWAFHYLVSESYTASYERVRHRIERDSNIDHRPLTALNDQPLIPDASGEERVLWQAHLARMQAMLSRLRVGVPSPGMARRDPRGLRAVVPLFLIIAIAAGGSEAGARLERALTPKQSDVNSGVLALDIWITPPAYTQVPPILLQGEGSAANQVSAVRDAGKTSADKDKSETNVVDIPVGSEILAQLGRAEGEANLMIGARPVPFAVLDEDNPANGQHTEAEIGDDDLAAQTLDVRLGDQIVDIWTVRVVADKRPVVEFTAPPKNMSRGRLGLQYEVKDDYTLSTLKLVIRHGEGWPLPSGVASAVFSLPLPNPGGATAGKGRTMRDFAAHPWAGTQVKVSLEARDGAGQEGKTEDVSIALPERIFNHPVARALIAARKKLNRPGEATAADVSKDLTVIAQRPQHFYNDTVVFLALSVANARLRHDRSAKARGDVQQILWETGLRLEDGEFVIAERDLREIHDRLEKSFRDGADDAVIERLMDQLQRAMSQYMQELAEHLRRNGVTMPENMMASEFMGNQDLQRILDRVRELSQAGAREAARNMLSQLKEKLKLLRNGVRLAQPRQGMNKGRQMLRNLRELSQRQQKLLDRTFRRQQMGRQPSPQGQLDGMRQLAPGQEQLRRDLGRMMRQMDEMLGAVSERLARAGQAMKGAGQALRDGEAGRATDDQTEALDELHRATDQLGEELARQQQGPQMGIGMGRQRGLINPRNRDPFGRRRGDGPYDQLNNGDVKVPSQQDILRARKIMQELRRRSGEQYRPRPERDYINRLIKRF